MHLSVPRRITLVSFLGIALRSNPALAAVQIPVTEILYHSTAASFQPNTAPRPWIQYAPDGSIGLVYRTTEYDSATQKYTLRIVYRAFRPDGSATEETVVEAVDVSAYVLPSTFMLFYDPLVQPHVVMPASGNRGGVITSYILHYWKTGAVWQSEAIDYPFQPSSVDFASAIGPSGDLHLLVRNHKYSSANIDFSLYYMTNRAGAWTCQRLEHYVWPVQPIWWNTDPPNLSLVVDDQGYAHAAYVLVYTPSPYYATAECRYATNRSGVWQFEIVVGPGDYDAFAGVYPCVAVRPNGEPAIASTYQSFAETGSMSNERLCYSTRSGPNAWQTATLATAADGYVGSDGNRFTGAWPHLRFDQSHRPHIVFADRASYHTPYQQTYVGQIRYAFHNGSEWNFATLYRQPVPVNPDNCEQIRVPNLAVSPGGGRLGVVGIRRVAAAGQVSWDVVRIQALNTTGDDAANTLRISGWTAPQTWLAFQSASGLMRAKVQAHSNGAYLFSLLPPGWSGTVTPSKTYCAFSPSGRTYSNLAAHQDNQNFTLLMGAIEGSVRNTETGRQPSGVLVKLFSRDGSYTGSSQTTNPQGNFRFNVVEPGEYFLTLSLAGYKPGRWPYDGCFIVQSNQTDTQWQIPLSPLATRAMRWTAYR